LQFGKGRNLWFDRCFDGAVQAADAQIDHVERLDSEIAQVVVDGALQVGGGEGRDP